MNDRESIQLLSIVHLSLIYRVYIKDMVRHKQIIMYISIEQDGGQNIAINLSKE